MSNIWERHYFRTFIDLDCMLSKCDRMIFGNAHVLNSSYTKWDKCCNRDADLHGWCSHCDGGVTDVDNSPIKWESCHFSSVSYLYSGHTLSSNFY